MTLRWRITGLAVAAVLVLLLIAGLAILQVHERLLTSTVDDQLGQKADVYTAALDAGERPELTPPGDEDSVAQLVRDGQVVVVAPQATGARGRAIEVPIANPPPLGRARVVREVRQVLPNEGSYRVLSVDLGDGLVLHLAGNLDDVRDSEGALRRAFGLSAPLIALALGSLIWWFVGRTLRPVESIRAQVSAIGGEDLHRRVPEPTTNDEVGRLARTMNDMLDRLEQAAERQRRFVADASHELRSPLARMRSELEVDLAHPAQADLAGTHQSALEEVVALQRLVDDLLHLARPDGAASRDVPHKAVDLDDLVLRAARRVRADGVVTIDTTAVGPAQVLGRADQLGRVVANLLDNAVRHAHASVIVELRERADGRAELVVADDGPGVPTIDRDRVFEPFTRLDEARQSATGGAGLGLAIVRELVEAHGGTVALAESQVGARFVVMLPCGL